MRYMTIACLMMMALCLGGCASDLKPSAAQTPATTSGTAVAPPAAVLVAPGDTSQPEPGTMRIKVYRGSSDAKWLLPEVFQVKKNDHPARTAMELLATPPQGSGMVGLLPKEAKIKGLWIKDEIAYVDFSEAIIQSAGSTSERLLVAAIVNTLTEFPEVQSVQFLVEGKRRATLQGHLDISEPLSRSEKIIKH
nr:GerMN domain-containing protein [uncultured Anaeromusa sp.]